MHVRDDAKAGEPDEAEPQTRDGQEQRGDEGARAALAQRARQGGLEPHEYQGGSFTISNLGMFGVREFAAIINPPQAAILAVGMTKPVFVGQPDQYQLRNRITLMLSYDARAIDEETAAHFLEKIQNNLENPAVLLNSDGTTNRRLSSLL